MTANANPIPFNI